MPIKPLSWSRSSAPDPLKPDAETNQLLQDKADDIVLGEACDDQESLRIGAPSSSVEERHRRRRQSPEPWGRTPATNRALEAGNGDRQVVHRARPEFAHWLPRIWPPYLKHAAALVLLACAACTGALALRSRQRPGEPEDLTTRTLMVPLAGQVIAPAGVGAAPSGGALDPEALGAGLTTPGAPLAAAATTVQPSAAAAVATPAPTPAPPPPPCAGSGESCVESHCCAAAGEQCYETHAAVITAAAGGLQAPALERQAVCMADCRAGPNMTDYFERRNLTCWKLGSRTPGRAKRADLTNWPLPRWAEKYCSSGKDDCRDTRCCAEEGMQCYARDESLARCRPSCTPAGIDMTDDDGKPWSCEEIGPRTPGIATEPAPEGLLSPGWVGTSCSVSGENCSATRCCSQDGYRCYIKNWDWSSCKPDCVPGPQPEDRADENWTCGAMGPKTPGVPKTPPIRRGSFLVVGDWGWEEQGAGKGKHMATGKCQVDVARAMDAKMDELGDVKFVVNVGDSFYQHGVLDRDDDQWDKKWRWIYSVQLRSIPWYSVYGNHDYHSDPCACTDNQADCAQVNYDEDNLEYFQMPGTSYFKEFPEMGIEVVGLDLNNFEQAPHNPQASAEQLIFSECFLTDCVRECLDVIRNRTLEGLDLFFKRAKESTAKSLVVFSHYPTDYLTGSPDFLKALSDNSTHRITYFGGHRHSVDNVSTVSIEPNKNWLVGGGGGFSCDSDSQGFVVGEIWGDSSVTTYPVLVDRECCS